MERIDTRNAMKRGLTSSVLAVTLAFSGIASAEGTTKAGEPDPAAKSPTSQQAQQVSRASALWGLSREQLKEVQRELAARGLYQGSIDGIPGAKTEAALRNFQTQQGLAVGGLNAQTRDALGIERQPVSGTDAEAVQKQSVRGTDSDARVQKQPVNGTETRTQAAIEREPGRDTDVAGTQLSSLSTDQAKQIQQRLQRDGYYQGTIDGVMGAQTRIALRRYFQKQAQLADQGMVSESALPMFETK